ncbi:MAG: tRNA uridine-5-carboxymethylaminomethyl(34) synthesis GTPase MnmE [bacterium]|nr:tRNA uridine-5-carboxymethylaminomethyl(34) synthesis GTPase MnmE [bacterium]
MRKTVFSGTMKLPDLQDTICALATAPGHAALAVVRVSGSAAFAIANRICEKKIPTFRQTSRVCYRTLLNRNGEELDRAVVLCFRAPHSFTGQDSIEFSVHGSPAIVEELLGELQFHGARLAGPGEFSLRAYWNGKISLDQAEGVSALIAATDSSEKRSSIRLLDGELGVRAKALQQRIEKIAGLLELSLDFSEEEVPLYDSIQLQTQIERIRLEIEELVEINRQVRPMAEGIQIALAGSANSGKSSLLNKLVARDKAIVSPVPGTTRDIVEGELLLAGKRVKIFDTAGIRKSRNAIEREGVRRSRAIHQSADLTLWLIPIDQWQEGGFIRETLPANSVANQWWIVNKFDLVEAEQRPATKRQIRHFLTHFDKTHEKPDHSSKEYFLSAKTGDGVMRLRSALEQWVAQRVSEQTSTNVLPMNQRHQEAFHQTALKLRKVERQLLHQETPEIIAEELRQAMIELGTIVGERTPDDVLAKVFSSFCIGK